MGYAYFGPLFDGGGAKATAPACEVVEEYGEFGTKNTREGLQVLKFQAVKWYGNNAQLDLRWWNENGRAGKGVTFDGKQAEALYECLKKIFEGGDNGVVSNR